MFRYILPVAFSAGMTIVFVAIYVYNEMPWDNFIAYFVPTCAAIFAWQLCWDEEGWPTLTVAEKITLVITSVAVSEVILQIAWHIYFVPDLVGMIY